MKADHLSVTFVPEDEVSLSELVADLSNELSGLVVGIVAEGNEILATVGERGQLSHSRHSVSQLASENPPRSRFEPDAVAAARALCVSLGIGFSSEEQWHLPPGGWGLASQSVGRGRLLLPNGWVEQERERFILGPGRDERGEPFIGIWDREAPARPIRRFAEEETARALRAYSDLRSGQNGDDG